MSKIKEQASYFRKRSMRAVLLVATMLGTVAIARAQMAQGHLMLGDANGAEGGSTISSAAIPAVSRPVAFTRIATGIKVSPLGFGLEIATPLTTRVDLRISDNLFLHRSSFTVDSVDLDSKLGLSSIYAGADLFPFLHSGFHVTPGVLFANHNHVSAIASVSGGEPFSPGNGNYLSSPADPVNGAVRIPLDSTAPTLSIGVGSLFPRSGRRWSVPFEVGVAYIGPPKVTMDLAGSVCDPGSGVCQPIASDPEAKANIALEAKKIQNDLAPLRTYPIVSVGFSYNFRFSRR